MKKSLSIIIVVITFCSIQGFGYLQDDNKNTSKFTGTWNWVEDIDSVQSFSIFVGERNDSLLFALGGIFYYGNRIHGYNFDNDGNFIADVRTVIPKGNKAISKISEFCSNFYSNPNKRDVYNPIYFELLNDTTMQFILDDNKAYWPDTAIMRRRDYKNHVFSLEEDYYLYKGK